MSKISQFFKEVWAELKKVVWPSRDQVIKYTAVVIIFSAVIAIILGAADLGLTNALQKVVNK